MKKEVKVLSAILVGLALLLGTMVFTMKQHRLAANKPPVVLTPQQKATHRILLLNEDEDAKGFCTAVAVGPETLMTAEHCIKEGKDEVTMINIDLSTHVYHIIAIGLDDRDHALLILDSPAFVNALEPDVSDTLKLGEPVYLYGDGEAVYPPRKLTGVVVDCNDPSDVDAAQGIVCFSIPAIPGDSGSMVFDSHDHLVAITTYRDVDNAASAGFRVQIGSFHLHAVKPKEKEDKNPFKGLFGF